MSITCTITRAGRFDEYGRPLTVSQSYTGEYDFVKSLVRSGFASVADQCVFDDDSTPNCSEVAVIPEGSTAVSAVVNQLTGGNVLSIGSQQITDAILRGVAGTDYADLSEVAISQAMRTRGLKTAPTVVETVPTIGSTGTQYFIDPVTGNNTNNGTSAATPWADIWKIATLNPGVGGVIHIAADAVFDYPQTLANYIASPTMPANCLNNMNGTAANPIVIRPYYPRGSTASKPIVRWYATTTTGDWTQEAGNGGKIWSAAWAVNKTYRSCGVLFGTDLRIGVAYNQQQNPGQPGVLVSGDQYTADNAKVYVYVPDGSNPVSYYGQIRLIGGRAAMEGFAGPTYLKVFGIRFDQMWVFNIINYGSTPSKALEFAYCDFSKCLSAVIAKNAGTNPSPQEMEISLHDNYIENGFHTAFHMNSNGGTAGNTISWEIYRNRVNSANLSSADMGGLAYIQAGGGTKHIAWGNYGYDCRNGTGLTQIDGSMIYADIYSSNVVFFGNVAERCGKAFQANCAPNVHVLSNLAIDCGCLVHITNATPQNTTPAANIAHNTWLWTGRIPVSSIPAGPNVGGTGIGDWKKQAVITQDNQQKGVNGNNFTQFNVLNNVAINASGVRMTDKNLLSLYQNGITTQVIAGNAGAGLATTAIYDKNTATDLTGIAGYILKIGSVSDALNWVSGAQIGVARPAPGSPLIGAGEPLSVQYQDIAGHNFAARPTIGCYEVNA